MTRAAEPAARTGRASRPRGGLRHWLGKLGGQAGAQPDDDDDPGRVYAIGDVHGRLDLFRELIDRIRDDADRRTPRRTRLVLLGDFVDRGPDSAALVRLLMRLRAEPYVVVLKGNHEAIMADALAGSFAALDLWLAHGGAATLQSFGMDPIDGNDPPGPDLLRRARQAVPPDVRAWLAERPTSVQFGRYYFVHAGVRPGVPLPDQRDEDRLWIGPEFTDSEADHGAVIVHGHTIEEAGIAFAGNRIGVDTGAYRTGRLSAVGLDGEERWTLTVTDDDLARRR